MGCAQACQEPANKQSLVLDDCRVAPRSIGCFCIFSYCPETQPPTGTVKQPPDEYTYREDHVDQKIKFEKRCKSKGKSLQPRKHISRKTGDHFSDERFTDK